MFTTALAIALSSAGLAVSAAAMALSLKVSRRHKLFAQRTEEGAAIVLRTAGSMLEQNATFADRLDGFEAIAADHLITRAEVSAAFAELAAIEEQRQQQALRNSWGGSNTAPLGAGAPAIAAPVPTGGLAGEAGLGQTDPWAASAAAPAPADPSALLREIAVMNERLKQRMQGMGGAY